jgi:hypothetical protein
MSVFSIRPPGLARRARRASIEPVLPALVRSVIFFAALATPFVIALLTR